MHPPIHSPSPHRTRRDSPSSPSWTISPRGAVAGLAVAVALTLGWVAGVSVGPVLAAEPAGPQETEAAAGSAQPDDPAATGDSTSEEELKKRCERLLERTRSLDGRFAATTLAPIRADLDTLEASLVEECTESRAQQLDDVLTSIERRGDGGDGEDWTAWGWAFGIGFLAATLVGLLYKAWT